ncbi:(2Fe-2S)-binding protein [Mangrovicoccus ximenensis]|uniref:(2Fe-2S)-binding protein n=1 Tax=Mangrovicoccus ximenensis TaxID=1911570 RepID=UPI000D3AA8CF|nr:(2Fe-2S)-binding protein [Mangrovicoccus ximenensis]
MQLNVNGTVREVDVDPDTPLLWVIREELGLTGTKYGCGVAQCGACTVLVDGQPTRSCITPAEMVEGTEIKTIETVEETETGRKVVEAWVEHQVPQCGYCQSGQVLAATALLTGTPAPTDGDIEAAMVNLCRCGTYNKIRAAVRAASEA